MAASPRIRQLEQAMYRRVNRDRRAQGKRALAYDEQLARVARVHSADMRDHGFFDHVSPTTGTPQERLDAAGYLFLTARENLAQDASVEQAEDDLLKSPHHYENIMAGDITRVGIGIVAVEKNVTATLIITQLFAKPARAESIEAARQSIMAKIRDARRQQRLSPLAEHATLTRLARRELAKLPDAPSESDLRSISETIKNQLEKEPLPGTKGVSVGGQVLPDSSEFQLGSALLRPDARYYGLAVDKSARHGERPLLRVLVVLGL